MTIVRSCSACFLVLVCGLAMAGCTHAHATHMAAFQPEGAPGDAAPPPAKRVTVGAVVEPGTTMQPATEDRYFHFQSPSDYANPASCKPVGFRAVCGPYGTANSVNVSVVSFRRPFDTTTIDQSPQIDAGYAAIWGWRPYIRLQRISAAAEGSWIIAQHRGPNSARILLVSTENNRPVTIWDNQKPLTDPAVFTFSGQGTFVDLTVANTGEVVMSAPALISSNAEATALLAHATSKMK